MLPVDQAIAKFELQLARCLRFAMMESYLLIQIRSRDVDSLGSRTNFAVWCAKITGDDMGVPEFLQHQETT